ncbi:MAG: hypothetical protein Q4C54_04255 [Clostridia bacterium]|nr:hypothetical protein [Clostridia bacterium]
MMNKREKTRSMGSQLLQFSRLLTVVLAVPAVISLVMMLVSSSIYHHTLSQMERVAQLQPVIKTDIPEAVWYAVAGRTSFEEGNVWGMVRQVTDTLDDMILADESEGLSLTIARRTMDTMAGYITQIETEMANRMPVVEL